MHAFVCLCTCAHLRMHCKMHSVNKIMIMSTQNLIYVMLFVVLLYELWNFNVACALTHLRQCSGIL